jgi:hypothetical protein
MRAMNVHFNHACAGSIEAVGAGRRAPAQGIPFAVHFSLIPHGRPNHRDRVVQWLVSPQKAEAGKIGMDACKSGLRRKK